MEPAQPPRRVACIGASITFGLGLANRRVECYPAMLQSFMGEQFKVRNFGYSGATAGRETNEPYWQTPSFTSATRFDPEVAIVAFGTNDAQLANLPNVPRFRDDYTALIEHFRSMPSKPTVLLATPPPVFEPPVFEGYGEIDLPTLDNAIRPAVREIGQTLGLPVIDTFSPFVGKAEWFTDNLHPNAEGASLIAESVYSALREHGLAG